MPFSNFSNYTEGSKLKIFVLNLHVRCQLSKKFMLFSVFMFLTLQLRSKCKENVLSDVPRKE